MGESVSKLDTSPLVCMCKERKEFIKAAKHCRYDLVSAFVIYLQSLLDVGCVLNQYVEEELVILDDDDDSSIQLSVSDSESDLHSLTDDDHLQCDMEEPEKPPNMQQNQEQSAANLGTKYMENRFSMGFPYYGDRFSHYPAEAISMDLSFNHSKLQKHNGLQHIPLPPPPPQVSMWDFLYLFSSNNDDVHYENHINYSSDFDVREVREREGIPDLEDENEQSSTKETKFDEKRLKGGSLNSAKNTLLNEEKNANGASSVGRVAPINGPVNTRGISHQTCSGGYLSQDQDQNEEKKVEDRGNNVSKKKMKDNNEVFVSKNLECVSLGTSRASTTPVDCCCRMGVKEAVEDIKDEFENLFEFGKEFSEIIEVGKLPHQPAMSTKLRGLASSILGHIIPSTVTCSRGPHMPLNQLASNARKINHKKHVCPKFGELSSTLEQLYMWEKRLFGEVMGEEKLRILYDKKCKRLKDLDDQGAEQDKVNDTFASVRSLESEINVSVASISVISREIHKLRDEKLLPELNKLIEGLIRLWKFMGTCHHKQFKAITEAKSHIHILEPGIRENSNSHATLRLEKTILNWGICFNNYVNTQKKFVKYLNEWLHRCILQEPEEIAQENASQIFTLCNDWYHSIDSISENGVSKAFSKFASSLHHIYEKQKEEEKQKARLDYLLKDYKLNSSSSCIDDVEDEVGVVGGFDESLTSLRKILVEERTRHKEIIREVNDAASSCLYVGLSPIFEVLESFCLENLKVYELLRIPKDGSHD